MSNHGRRCERRHRDCVEKLQYLLPIVIVPWRITSDLRFMGKIPLVRGSFYIIYAAIDTIVYNISRESGPDINGSEVYN